MLTVEVLRRILGLVPHPVEGGYTSGLPSRFGTTRAASTAIWGPDLEAGQRPQVIVPRDTWQGTRLLPGGHYALLGTTVASGFDYTDYETAPRAPRLATPPTAKDLIIALTR
jgi:predicted cupin superfamily sugar epimerase